MCQVLEVGLMLALSLRSFIYSSSTACLVCFTICTVCGLAFVLPRVCMLQPVRTSSQLPQPAAVAFEAGTLEEFGTADHMCHCCCAAVLRWRVWHSPGSAARHGSAGGMCVVQRHWFLGLWRAGRLDSRIQGVWHMGKL